VYGTANFAIGTRAFSADYPGEINPATGNVDSIGRINNAGIAIGMRRVF
jgi:hypothetical protein